MMRAPPVGNVLSFAVANNPFEASMAESLGISFLRTDSMSVIPLSSDDRSSPESVQQDPCHITGKSSFEAPYVVEDRRNQHGFFRRSGTQALSLIPTSPRDTHLVVSAYAVRNPAALDTHPFRPLGRFVAIPVYRVFGSLLLQSFGATEKQSMVRRLITGNGAASGSAGGPLLPISLFLALFTRLPYRRAVNQSKGCDTD
ncbi:hypothetical protein LZ30DRAFT_698442 [Colletotrichum cereale]|nr:hypothetical protein LZ30DRAFT_698442 [Colletotrichum cereale]